MTTSGADGLEALVSGLERLVPTTDERVSIVVETGEDEAIMVATRAALMKLALALLHSVASSERRERSPKDIDGTRVEYVDLSDCYDSYADVVPDCLLIAANDADRRRLASRLSSTPR